MVNAVSPCTLSASEWAALAYLEKHGPARLSAIGFSIREVVPPTADRKRSPSPQGVALFASRFVRHLAKRELVHPVIDGWAISSMGRACLTRLAAEHVVGAHPAPTGETA